MKTPIRDEILNVAGVLFYNEGIRAVGIDRIIEKANVAKATLYRHFPSKDHLVAAYLEQRHHRVMQSLQEVLTLVDRPRDQIRTVFERLFEKADSPEFRGCAFALAVAEHGDSDRVVGVARQHKQAVRTLLETIMTAAGVTAPQPAAHLALLYEGALATVAVARKPDAVLTARDCALSVFDWATMYSDPTGNVQ